MNLYPSRGCVFVIRSGSSEGLYALDPPLPSGRGGAHFLLLGVDIEDSDTFAPTPTLTGRGVVYEFGRGYGALVIRGSILLGSVPEARGFQLYSQNAVKALREWFNQHRLTQRKSSPVLVKTGPQTVDRVLLHSLTLANYDPETNTQPFAVQAIIVPPASPMDMTTQVYQVPEAITAGAAAVNRVQTGLAERARANAAAANETAVGTAAGAALSDRSAAIQAGAMDTEAHAERLAAEAAAEVAVTPGTPEGEASRQREVTLAERAVGGALGAAVRSAGKSASGLLPGLLSGRISGRSAMRSMQRGIVRSSTKSLAGTLGGAVGGKVGRAISSFRVDGLSLSSIGSQLESQAINQAARLAGESLESAALGVANQIEGIFGGGKLPGRASLPPVPSVPSEASIGLQAPAVQGFQVPDTRLERELALPQTMFTEVLPTISVPSVAAPPAAFNSPTPGPFGPV